MAFDPLTAVFTLGSKLLDRIIPDPTQKAAAQVELLKLQQSGELTKLTAETDLVKAFLADTQSARGRDVEVVKIKGNNRRGDILAYSGMGALIACILLLFVFKVPQESRDLLLVTLGALVAIVKDIYGFEFGSSKDSQRNAQAVTDMLKQPPTP